jgi:hypothetical protein
VVHQQRQRGAQVAGLARRAAGRVVLDPELVVVVPGRVDADAEDALAHAVAPPGVGGRRREVEVAGVAAPEAGAVRAVGERGGVVVGGGHERPAAASAAWSGWPVSSAGLTLASVRMPAARSGSTMAAGSGTRRRFHSNT